MGIVTGTTYTCDSCGVTEAGNDAVLSVSNRWYKRALASYDRWITERLEYRHICVPIVLCQECAIGFDEGLRLPSVIKEIVEHGKQYARTAESIRDESSSSGTDN